MRTLARQAALLLALGLAAAVAIWAVRRPAPAAGPPSLTFLPGARQAYRLVLQSVVQFGGAGSGGARAIPQTVAGTLHLRVLDPGPEGARVALQLAGANLSLGGKGSAELDRQLGRLFVATFSADGAIGRIEFSPAIGGEARALLEETLRTFEVIVPRGAGAAWTTEELHASGRYRADYRYTSDGRILKSKVAYLQATEGTSVSIRRAAAAASIDPRASWLERIVDEEALSYSLGEGVFTASSLRAELVRQPWTPASPPLEIDEVPGSYREVSAALAEQEPAPDAPPPVVPATAARGLAEVVRALDAKGGRSAALVYELRDLIIRDPAAAGRILALLRAGVPDGTAAALLNALGLAATEEAQDALRRVMKDDAFGKMNRKRAAIALGGASEIGNESLAALRAAAGGQDDLADTAVLSLGMAADTLRQGGSARYEGVRSDLMGRLEGAQSANSASAALLALGNTHDPSLAETIATRLSDGSPAARAAAAHALGKLGAAVDPDLLAQRLAVEEDGAVRRTIGASLNALPTPSAGVLALVNDAIARERDSIARLEMARLLGENLAAYPPARQTLAALANQDPYQPIRVYATHKVWGRTR